MRYSIVILAVLVVSASESHTNSQDELILVNSFGHNTLVSPQRGFVYNNGTIYVYDSQGEFPLYRIDVQTGSISGFGTFGNDEGQVSKEGNKTLSLSDNYLFLYDNQTRKIHRYSFNGDTKEVIDITLPISGNLYMVTDSTFIFYPLVVPDNDNYGGLIVGGSITHDRDIILDLPHFPYYMDNDIAKLEKNILLKYFSNLCMSTSRSNFYVGFLFTSLILGGNIEGDLLFSTYEPDGIFIPEIEVTYNQDGGIKVDFSDHILDNPPRTIALSADSDYLYVLYSGEKISRWQLIRAVLGGRIRLAEGRTLYIYHKETGRFLHSLELPVWAEDILVYENFVFLLTDSKIVQYKKSEFINK